MKNIGDYAENLKTLRKSPFDMKPSDCKHCYAASVGVVGTHYSCDCKESKRYNSYPLIMCPQDCEHYECENEPKDGLFGEE